MGYLARAVDLTSCLVPPSLGDRELDALVNKLPHLTEEQLKKANQFGTFLA